MTFAIFYVKNFPCCHLVSTQLLAWLSPPRQIVNLIHSSHSHSHLVTLLANLSVVTIPSLVHCAVCTTQFKSILVDLNYCQSSVFSTPTHIMLEMNTVVCGRKLCKTWCHNHPYPSLRNVLSCGEQCANWVCTSLKNLGQTAAARPDAAAAAACLACHRFT